MKYMNLTIDELHALLVNKEVTPLELTKEAIELAKADNNNAFEYIMEKEALEYASKLGEPEVDNPLWGIPFAIKDNFSTKDVPTTGSSNILNGYVPVFTATVVEKLLAKGAIPIGKTTLDELAMGGTGLSGHLGMTYNPYDPTHTRLIGGSSCGSAAVTANAVVPYALGSDTGDSIRKPASYAGLVGLKPTWSRISRYGLFPFAPSMDTVGFFTRSVKDCGYLLNVTSGRDENDSTSSTREVEDYVRLIGKPVEGLKVAVIKEINEAVKDKDIMNAFNKNIEGLKAKGVVVEEVSLDQTMLASVFPTYFVISCAEATSNNANLDGIKFGPYYDGKTYQEVMFNARTAGFSELIKRRFVIGSYALMRENQDELFQRAQKNRRKIVNAVNAVLANYDFIYTPASPKVAPVKDESGDRLNEEYMIADNHLALGNFAGLPSITVPIGLKDKLPFGGNVMGRAFEDAKVLQLADAIESITGLKGLNAKEVK
ncbi:MAG: aspartyl/glutamyl-tRNA amidotransferase subunit A [Bacilli bacterium]|nr:aspartyl/glutamyl-tRNA amidotransferase subunit A [Bacilli bacterium]